MSTEEGSQPGGDCGGTAIPTLAGPVRRLTSAQLELGEGQLLRRLDEESLIHPAVARAQRGAIVSVAEHH